MNEDVAKTNLLIVSPSFPNAIGGVGDFARHLGEELKQRGDVKVAYAGMPQKAEVVVDNYFRIDANENTLSKLALATKASVVHLNYSGYGYQEKGMPLWLVRELAEIKQRCKLITFFHELYARGKPWQRSFFMSPIQRWTFKQIYNLSDVALCSTDRMLAIIGAETKDAGARAANIGIYSNVPEPDSISPWSQRGDVAVVFGGFETRRRIYQEKELLLAALDKFKISKLIDIGGGDVRSSLAEIAVEKVFMGTLPLEKIGEVLGTARFGFAEYNEEFLGKSGIFAAYAAYGAIPVNFGRTTGSTDGLSPGVNFLQARKLSSVASELETISANIVNWYSERSLKQHATRVMGYIQELQNS